MEIRRTHSSRKEAIERFEQILSGVSEPLLLLFSGGSSNIFFEEISPSLIPKNSTISVLDERCTDEEEHQNYSRLLHSGVGELILNNIAYGIDPRPQGDEDWNESSLRFDATLKLWREANPTGVVIITQGIGEDGHTAGIIPDENKEIYKERFLGDAWAVFYESESKSNEFPKRLTVTHTFLREEVRIALVYTNGDQDKPVLDIILSPEGTLSHTPARIIRDMRSVVLYTDILDKV